MTEQNRQLDVLFVSEAPPWPLDQGFCIRGYNIASAMQRLGVRVGLASHQPLPLDAPASLRAMALPWPTAAEQDQKRFMDGWSGRAAALRRRLANHQGRDLATFAGIMPLVEGHQPKAVIGLGQHSPLMLRALKANDRIKRIWYAADELVSFHLTCLRRDRLVDIPHRLRLIALYATLEKLFVAGLDGAIGVNPSDTKMLQRIACARNAVTIRNGVDTEYFHPTDTPARSKELMFWGRMDFESNIDAVCWFARHVFPSIRALCHSARFSIIGKEPHKHVTALAQHEGIDVVGPVPDIRPYAQTAALTVLPMRSGTGIKNKLLEAAAMGRPIVASAHAVRGLAFDGDNTPIAVCNSASQWVETICRLWSDPGSIAGLGAGARQWVTRFHSWDAAADKLVRWINALPMAGAEMQDEIQITHLPDNATESRANRLDDSGQRGSPAREAA